MKTEFKPVSAADKATVKYLKEQGYEFNLCWMGNATQDYRVTFRGEYIGNDTDKENAFLIAILHDDDRKFKLI